MINFITPNIDGVHVMKSRLDRTLDILIILGLLALITGHLMSWGRSRSVDAPVYDYAPIDRK